MNRVGLGNPVHNDARPPLPDHPVTKTLVASRAGRIAEDRAALNEVVPVEFLRALHDAGLVNPAAPLPGRA